MELKTIDLQGKLITQVPLDQHDGIVLNDIPNGTDIYNRIGRKVNIKSVAVRGNVIWDGTAEFGVVVRLLLVWDRMPNSTAKAAGDLAKIIQNNVISNTATAATEFPYAFPNLAYRDRFVILKDKTIQLQPVHEASAGVFTNGALAPIVKTFTMYKKLNATTIYSTTDTAADVDGSNIATGRLMFYACSTAAKADVYLNARVRFTDA